MKSKLLIVTANSYAHAYGGMIYLARALHNRGVEVLMLGHVPVEHLAAVPRMPFRVINLPSLPLAGVPIIRGIIKTICIILHGAQPGTDWLFNDYGFYRHAVFLKWLLPKRRLIHYTTEFLTPEEQPRAGLGFYARHATVPDLIIDVEPNRAARRQERFGMSTRPLVLPNSLPSADFPEPETTGSLAKLAGVTIPKNRFILLYGGTAHPSMSFHRLLEAIKGCPSPIFLLCFLRGESKRISAWRKQMEATLGPEGGCICQPVARADLLRAMPEAGAGLIYYPPSDEPSTNQLYCAPTKLYEYLAAGIPVVGTANPSLRNLLEPNGLGFCADEDSPHGLIRALHKTINQFGTNHAGHRKKIRDYFLSHLTFESTSKPVLKSICALISEHPAP